MNLEVIQRIALIVATVNLKKVLIVILEVILIVNLEVNQQIALIATVILNQRVTLMMIPTVNPVVILITNLVVNLEINHRMFLEVNPILLSTTPFNSNSFNTLFVLTNITNLEEYILAIKLISYYNPHPYTQYI